MHLNYNLHIRPNSHSFPKKSHPFVSAWVRFLGLYQFNYFLFVCIFYFCLYQLIYKLTKSYLKSIYDP